MLLIKPFECQGLIILHSKILSNQGHMTSCAKLSGLLLDTKLKVKLSRLRKFLPNRNFHHPFSKKYHHLFAWYLKLKTNEF